MMLPRKYLILAGVAVALIVGLSIVVYAMEQAVPLFVEGTVVNLTPTSADASFQNIGEYYVSAQCSNVNVTDMCPVVVSVSLSSLGQLHTSLYTKSITFKVLSAQGSQLAVELDTLTNPPTTYQIGYGSEQPSTVLVTVSPPTASPGSTWTFKVVIIHPPKVNGKLMLSLVGMAQVVDSHFLGRTYDLEASFALYQP